MDRGSLAARTQWARESLDQDLRRLAETLSLGVPAEPARPTTPDKGVRALLHLEYLAETVKALADGAEARAKADATAKKGPAKKAEPKE